MKAARLLAYGIGGIILGLLLENTALRLRSKGEKQLGRLAKATRKKAGQLMGVD